MRPLPPAPALARPVLLLLPGPLDSNKIGGTFQAVRPVMSAFARVALWGGAAREAGPLLTIARRPLRAG